MPAESPVETDAAIRGAGLRVTDTRREVLQVLQTQPHARADDVFARVRETLPATSLQSVYNALGDFVDAGLARRIEPEGHPGLFELRVADNHHHIVCRSCGRVEDVDCVQEQAPCLHPAPAQTHGFTVQAAEVTFWGVCPECATADLPLSRSTKGKR
ncbi:transcriptional repressor [Microbacteriaceae bacterium VKM Ac-2855]|nr:transcriptional repressor [Microbacteriaceae bacterium VKM Ac-2855]